MPSADSFVHLHVHTEYSMLDGAARIDELFRTAHEFGQPALATTDHGYIFGAYEFWKAAQKYDVKPIIGVEAYITPQTHRSDRRRVKWGDASSGRDDVSGARPRNRARGLTAEGEARCDPDLVAEAELRHVAVEGSRVEPVALHEVVEGAGGPKGAGEDVALGVRLHFVGRARLALELRDPRGGDAEIELA